MTINAVIERLEQQPDWLAAHWCLPREEARFLYLLATIGRLQRMLEIGTSIGYSTLHLAQAAQEIQGQVLTIDASGERQAQALAHLTEAGLESCVQFQQGDALTSLKTLQTAGKQFDLMFVDARKSEYANYLAVAEDLLPVGGVFLADNTRSHRDKMSDFIERIHQSPLWVVSDLETPSGLVLARKQA